MIGFVSGHGISPVGAPESSPARERWEPEANPVSPVGAKGYSPASNRSPDTKRLLTPPTGLACFRTGSTGLPPYRRQPNLHFSSIPPTHLWWRPDGEKDTGRSLRSAQDYAEVCKTSEICHSGRADGS